MAGGSETHRRITAESFSKTDFSLVPKEDLWKYERFLSHFFAKEGDLDPGPLPSQAEVFPAADEGISQEEINASNSPDPIIDVDKS